MLKSGRLSNGLRWVIIPDETAKTVSVRLITPAGSRMEPEGKRGLAHLVEHLLFKGTSRQTSKELLGQIYGVGGDINAETGLDEASYYCKVRPRNLDLVLNFFSEMLWHSSFTEESIENEKVVVWQEVVSRVNTPLGKLELELLPQYAWAGSSAEIPVGGYYEDIMSITRQDVLDFVGAMYRPDGIVIAISGKIEGSNLETKLNHYFNYQVETKELKPEESDSRLSQTEPQLYTLTEGRDEAMMAIVYSHDSSLSASAIDILSHILMATMTCRLFTRLRSELSLIYSVDPIIHNSKDVSLFGFAVYTRNEEQALQKCQEESLAIIDDLVEQGITEAELQRAKSYLVESKYISLEDTMTLASYYGGQLLGSESLLPYQDSINNLLTTSRDDVRDTANQLFRIDRLNLAIVD